jgi:hypothetical protein
MKIVITSAILAAGVMAGAAGSAYAASSAYCAQQAQYAVNTYTHPLGSAAVGCVAGGILGNILSKGNGGATAGGCAAGAATGLVLSASKRQQIYNDAYYQCMGSYPTPAPQPVYAQPMPAGPPPSDTATVYVQVNVRSGPGTQYATVFTLTPYSNFPVSQCTPSWCMVGDSNQYGWASRKYLFFN